MAKTKVYIMSGISGGGKSTEAGRIAETYDAEVKGKTFGRQHAGALIVSADNYFTGHGRRPYHFDPRSLPAAHADCLGYFLEGLIVENCARNYFGAIIVDNTNLTTVEMAPYVALAAMVGAEIEIVTVHCDPKVAAARNVHGVPAAKVEQMDRALRNRSLPPFWNVTQRTVNTNPIG